MLTACSLRHDLFFDAVTLGLTLKDGQIEVLPWPEELPDFVGMKFLTYSEGYHNPDDGPFRGTGLEVRKETHYGWKPHPDPAFPDLVRALYIGRTLKVPANASPEVKNCVGTEFVHERFYRIDRDRKALQLLGGNDVPEETTDPYPPRWEQAPLVKAPVGGWSWHIHPKGDLQHALNANNTVLRCVNFKSGDVIRTGDPTKSMSFFIAKPAAEREKAAAAAARQIPPGLDVPICKDLLPPVTDDIDSRLYEMQRYFHEQNVFRAPNEPGPVRVEYSSHFRAVSQVQPHAERFWGEVEVEFMWPLTKQDVADYVAHPGVVGEGGWVPQSFNLPQLRVTNGSFSKGSEEFAEVWSPVRVRVTNDRRVIASQKLHATGDFHEPFELESYPFDVQPLCATLETTSSVPRSALHFVPVVTPSKRSRRIVQADQFSNINLNEITETRDTEWEAIGAGSECTFIPDQHDDDLINGTAESGAIVDDDRIGTLRINVAVVVQRHYAVHMYRVVLVMSCLSLMAITALCRDENVTCMDRLGMLMTLLLATCTYSLVVGASLPRLGYLTLLDKYVLAVFAYIGVLTSEVAILEWITVTEELEGLVTYGNIGLWTVGHLICFLVVWFSVLPKEAAKAKVSEIGLGAIEQQNRYKEMERNKVFSEEGI